jgi:HAD superfamily hydrolase (TIGR01549 family)
VSTDPITQIAELAKSTRWLLLDFDGPVCAIFAGLPASEVAFWLRELVSRAGGSLTDAPTKADDPLELLRFVEQASPHLVPRVESELRTFEYEAAATARPTAHAAAVLAACQDTRRPVAVVSNNSRDAVTRYLQLHNLSGQVAVVVGREDSAPSLMKPNPHLVDKAIGALNAIPEHCLMVGDSVSDIEAAAQSGVRSVGYANKPGKSEALHAAGADSVITTMELLATTLQSIHPAR